MPVCFRRKVQVEVPILSPKRDTRRVSILSPIHLEQERRGGAGRITDRIITLENEGTNSVTNSVTNHEAPRKGRSSGRAPRGGPANGARITRGAGGRRGLGRL